MVDIKLTTCAQGWPWARQTPGRRLEWGPFRFHVDTPVEKCDAWVVFESLPLPEETSCPAENVFFIAGEPDSIGSYDYRFLQQFRHIVSGRSDVKHPGLIRIQQGHPWFVEKDFDELVNMQPIQKFRDVSVISSDKDFTEGHRARLEFVRALKERFGERVDVWGRGIRDFERKWDVLAPYRYAIVLENFDGADFLTEKLPDALLAYCFPIYYGCKNLERYFSDEASMRFDVDEPDVAFSVIEKILADPNDYENRIGGIIRSRFYYLNNLQFFANLSNILHITMVSDGLRKTVNLLPDSHFVDTPSLGINADVSVSHVSGQRSPKNIFSDAFGKLRRGLKGQ